MKHALRIILSLTIAALAGGCGLDKNVGPTTDTSGTKTKDVAPPYVFVPGSSTDNTIGLTDANAKYTFVYTNIVAVCANCHNSSRPSMRQLTNYAELKAAVTPGKAQSSVAYQVIKAKAMPLGGYSVSDAALVSFAGWINLGALNN